MPRRAFPVIVTVVLLLAAVGGFALAAQDKYTVQVPDGLAFSEFRGYEEWQVIAVSQTGDLLVAILGNPETIAAFQAGVPGNGKPFPDGSKMAKIHWNQKKSAEAPAPTMVPDTLHDIDFMVRDSKEVRGRRQLGIRPIQLRRRVRHVHALGDRRQLRDRVPHDREGKGLRVHGLPEEVSGVLAIPPWLRRSTSPQGGGMSSPTTPETEPH